MNVRRRVTLLAALPLFALAGCANPTFIGVQDYGSIFGNVVTAAGAPISGAYVSATGTTTIVQTAANGSFTLGNVAVGQQSVTAQAPGYSPVSSDVVVTKDGSVNVGNLTLTATTSTPVTK